MDSKKKRRERGKERRKGGREEFKVCRDKSPWISRFPGPHIMVSQLHFWLYYLLVISLSNFSPLTLSNLSSTFPFSPLLFFFLLLLRFLLPFLLLSWILRTVPSALKFAKLRDLFWSSGDFFLSSITVVWYGVNPMIDSDKWKGALTDVHIKWRGHLEINACELVIIVSLFHNKKCACLGLLCHHWLYWFTCKVIFFGGVWWMAYRIIRLWKKCTNMIRIESSTLRSRIPCHLMKEKISFYVCFC